MEKDVLKDVQRFMKQAMAEAEKNLPKPQGKSNFTQMQIILYLIKHSGEDVYVSDLVENLNLKKSSITERLDIMEDTNIIRRVVDEDDKRKKKVFLTELALERKKEIEQVFISITDKMTKDIPSDKLQTFYEVLENMERNLNK